jgi:tetratricopeptide (TPR) repeat protein
VRGAVDNHRSTGWAVSPQFGKDHLAVFELAEKIGDGQASRLRVQLHHQYPGQDQNLGRFRLSFTNDAATLQATRIRLDLKDSEVVDLYVALGTAYAEQGRANEAAASFTEALGLVADRAGKAKIITEAAPLEGVLEKLIERAADDGRFQAELARHFADQGHAPSADAALAKARAWFEEKLSKEPENSAWAAEWADLLLAAGRTREAVPHLASLSAAKPKDLGLFLKVAALQAWFGQEKEFAATRLRLLASAKGANEAILADNTARACSIRSSTDQAELEAAVALARTAVKRSNPGMPFYSSHLLAVGMAEYRSDHDAAAEEALLAAMKADPNNSHVTGVSAFYRAMSLFRQNKRDEARNLAITAAAKMKPLPRDANNPLAGNASHDDLILWLAYKEAQALLQFDAAPLPKVENDKK